jgi:hypothetical protein
VGLSRAARPAPAASSPETSPSAAPATPSPEPAATPTACSFTTRSATPPGSSSLYDNGAFNESSGGGPDGIRARASDDVVLQYNASYGDKSKSVDGGGFDLDGDTTNAIARFNCGHGAFQFSPARAFHDNVVRYDIGQNDGFDVLTWDGNFGAEDEPRGTVESDFERRKGGLRRAPRSRSERRGASRAARAPAPFAGPHRPGGASRGEGAGRSR